MLPMHACGAAGPSVPTSAKRTEPGVLLEIPDLSLGKWARLLGLLTKFRVRPMPSRAAHESGRVPAQGRFWPRAARVALAGVAVTGLLVAVGLWIGWSLAASAPKPAGTVAVAQPAVPESAEAPVRLRPQPVVSAVYVSTDATDSDVVDAEAELPAVVKPASLEGRIELLDSQEEQ